MSAESGPTLPPPPMPAVPMVPLISAGSPSSLPPPPAGIPGGPRPAKKVSSGVSLIGLVVAALALCIVGGAIWAGNQIFGEKTFQVGDCVEVTDRVLDNDLKKTSCPSTYDLTSNVYQVVDVIDGDDGTCYSGVVTFSHEPHDKTYCLGYPEDLYGD